MTVYSKCSDYSSAYCPCVLAENGHCIVCSMCRGEDFCDCRDTVSFCVYQELINNGGKARKPRPDLQARVVHVKEYGDSLRLIRLSVPDSDINDFRELGAYVFVRTENNVFFDVPISVIYEDYDSGSICLLIQVRGIKTKYFKDIKKDDVIHLRGPFFNGIQGRKNIAGMQHQRAIVICRGIGFLPSLNVIQTLRENNNEVIVFLDRGTFSEGILDVFKDLFEISVRTINVSDDLGEIDPEMKEMIRRYADEGIDLIHLGLSDYLVEKFAGFFDEIGLKSDVSYINNSHMCCGEGICGACTKNIDSGHVVHLCKEQYNMMRKDN